MEFSIFKIHMINKELQKIPIDNTFPKYIQDNQDKLKNIILF